ncbi:hypothetical protein LDB30_06380 [Acidithiobacillus ferrooxidans]|nr:hypothetical protein LDB30_06380 [Acidithiobacillus ferrooxidans]
MSRKTDQTVSTLLPEKTSKLSVEIFRLMREGDVDSRNKAQNLLRSAMMNSLSPSTRINSGGK